MKPLALLFCLFCSFCAVAQPPGGPDAPNVFIITIDGLRWQELFNGADERIIDAGKYVSDTALVKEMYWDKDTTQRRKKLLPFLWNVVARKGQIYGNRNYGNRMNVANRYKFFLSWVQRDLYRLCR